MSTVDPVIYTLTKNVPTKIFSANITGTVQVWKNGLLGNVYIIGTDVDVAPIAPFEGIHIKKNQTLSIGALNGTYYWAVATGASWKIAVSKDISYNRERSVDVKKQDQTTAFDDFFFTQQIGIPTILTAGKTFDPDVPDYTLDVASIDDISIGDLIFVFTGPSGEERFFQAVVLGIATLKLTLDRPIDFSFESDDVVISTTKDLNIDGSTTPQIFEIRAGGSTSTLEFDITRILAQNLSDDTVDLSKFGDITGGLTRGLQLRDKRSETEFKNKWNVKINADFGLLGFDWTPYLATNPAQGQDGFSWRYTINGDDKHGVVKRIGSNRSLQIIVQDNLTSLASFEVIGANHEVD